MNPSSWPLSIKFSLTITAIVAGVGFMIGAVIVAQDWRRFHKELGKETLLLAESVAATAPRAMLRNDYWALYQSLKNTAVRSSGVKQQTRVITGMILDAQGNVQTHLQTAIHPIGLQYTPANEEEQRLLEKAMSARIPRVFSSDDLFDSGFLEGVVPLFSDQKYLGVVRIRLSIDELFVKARDSAITVLALTFIFVIIGSLFGAFASRRMVRPLTAVTQGLEAVGRGDMTTVAPIPVDNGDEIGRLGATFNKIMTELAEKKALEEEVSMSEKMVALGRITAGVAHEVNNPLAGLLNCISTLRKHPDDPQLVKRYLPLIEQGLHRIRDIVRALLVELRVEDSDEPVSISHLNQVRDLLIAEIGERNIKIIWENRVDDKVFIQGGRMEQIVFNLLKNAVQALPEGGTVAFHAFHDGPCLVIEVSDNGPGISVQHRKHLFDPFFTTRLNGTGLGLWIVYRLVQSMQGVIEVESEEGQGTLFKVVVPIVIRKAA